MNAPSSLPVAITLPDGKVRRFPGPVTGAEIAASIGPGLAKAALAVKVDGDAQGPRRRAIDRDAKIAHRDPRSPEALEILRHDAAHVMAEAVKELYPGTQVTFGPATENGFYYDFARDQPFTPEDLAKIEQRMHEIVDRDEPITREVWERDQASAFFADDRREIQGRVDRRDAEGRGDHPLPAGRLRRPLPRAASALDRQARQGLQADEGGRRLLARRREQRAAPARLRHGLGGREGAEAYLFQLEEAEKRDHRRLGREMDLFHQQEEAVGIVFWHPKGWTL